MPEGAPNAGLRRVLRLPDMNFGKHECLTYTLKKESMTDRNPIRDYYLRLYQVWGPQHWWPARTRFEVIVGAYLTQNTSWKNVELALSKLRRKGLLSLKGIREVSMAELEAAIRSAGYFRQKTARLKTIVEFIDERYDGSLDRMFTQPTLRLREHLLSLNGVGPETADSILLYAGQHPVFVVDAYTRRILERHNILANSARYEEVRELCESSLSDSSLADKFVTQNQSAGNTPTPPVAHRPSAMSRAARSPLAQIYNDMHGLVVQVGKHYCLKSRPRCETCPLKEFLPSGSPTRINADPNEGKPL